MKDKEEDNPDASIYSSSSSVYCALSTSSPKRASSVDEELQHGKRRIEEKDRSSSSSYSPSPLSYSRSFSPPSRHSWTASQHSSSLLTPSVHSPGFSTASLHSSELMTPVVNSSALMTPSPRQLSSPCLSRLPSSPHPAQYELSWSIHTPSAHPLGSVPSSPRNDSPLSPPMVNSSALKTPSPRQLSSPCLNRLPSSPHPPPYELSWSIHTPSAHPLGSLPSSPRHDSPLSTPIPHESPSSPYLPGHQSLSSQYQSGHESLETLSRSISSSQPSIPSTPSWSRSFSSPSPSRDIYSTPLQHRQMTGSSEMSPPPSKIRRLKWSEERSEILVVSPKTYYKDFVGTEFMKVNIVKCLHKGCRRIFNSNRRMKAHYDVMHLGMPGRRDGDFVPCAY